VIIETRQLNFEAMFTKVQQKDTHYTQKLRLPIQVLKASDSSVVQFGAQKDKILYV